MTKQLKLPLEQPFVLDDINKAVVERITSRAKAGMETYGVPMTRPDVTPVQWAEHLLEELLDAAVYLERLRRELQKIEDQLPPERRP